MNSSKERDEEEKVIRGEGSQAICLLFSRLAEKTLNTLTLQKCQSQSLNVSKLGLLHIYYGYQLSVPVGLLTVGVGCLYLCYLLLESFSSHCIASSNLHMMICTQFYYNLLCLTHVWLISLEDMFFLKGRGVTVNLGERVSVYNSQYNPNSYFA